MIVENRFLRLKKYTIPIVILFCIFLFSYASNVEASNGFWTTRAPMPTARAGLASASVNGKIYAIGGVNSRGFLRTNEEYDPVTDTWMTKASMPIAREGLAAASVNGKIYAIGGYNGNYLFTNEEYNPNTNTWTTKASITPRFGDASPIWGGGAGLAAASVNGKIYAIGGFVYTRFGNINAPQALFHFSSGNLEYDPTVNTWTTKTSMPSPRSFLGSAVVNGRTYTIGGSDFNSYLHINKEYNPNTNTWTTKAPMPIARRELGVVSVANGKIYAIGGETYYNPNSYYFSTNEEYNPIANTWTSKAPMPTARAGLAVISVNGKIYAIGGYNNHFLHTNEEYTPPSQYIDIGLREYNGTNIVKIAAELAGPLTSPLRIYKNGKIYSVVLVDPSNQYASKVRIKTNSGIKSLRKL